MRGDLMGLFETGPVLVTVGIRNLMSAGDQAIDVIQRCLDRHCSGDWGDLCDDDKHMNDDSLEAEKSGGFVDRPFSSYETSESKLRKLAEENQLKIDFDKILPILYDIGAIGNISIFQDEDKVSKRYHFKYRERYSMYNKNQEIIIHLALQHALKIKGVSSANIVDFE